MEDMIKKRNPIMPNWANRFPIPEIEETFAPILLVQLSPVIPPLPKIGLLRKSLIAIINEVKRCGAIEVSLPIELSTIRSISLVSFTKLTIFLLMKGNENMKTNAVTITGNSKNIIIRFLFK